MGTGHGLGDGSGDEVPQVQKMNAITLEQLETRIAAHMHACPSMAYSCRAIGEILRVKDRDLLRTALRNLCLRGVLEQVSIRLVDHWQARVSVADRIARQRDVYSVKPLKGYEKELMGHWHRAEACGGRA